MFCKDKALTQSVLSWVGMNDAISAYNWGEGLFEGQGVGGLGWVKVMDFFQEMQTIGGHMQTLKNIPHSPFALFV